MSGLTLPQPEGREGLRQRPTWASNCWETAGLRAPLQGPGPMLGASCLRAQESAGSGSGRCAASVSKSPLLPQGRAGDGGQEQLLFQALPEGRCFHFTPGRARGLVSVVPYTRHQGYTHFLESRPGHLLTCRPSSVSRRDVPLAMGIILLRLSLLK